MSWSPDEYKQWRTEHPFNHEMKGCIICGKSHLRKTITCSSKCSLVLHLAEEHGPSYFHIEEALRIMYWEEYQSLSEIALNLFGEDSKTETDRIRNWMIALGIKRRTIKEDCRVRKLGLNKNRKMRAGKNHPWWRDSLSDEDRELNKQRKRNEEGYSEWRRTVYARDNYECQCCGVSGKSNLVAHHLYSYARYKQLRTDPDNGITLCSDCHNQFHKCYGNKHNTASQFIEFYENFMKK